MRAAFITAFFSLTLAACGGGGGGGGGNGGNLPPGGGGVGTPTPSPSTTPIGVTPSPSPSPIGATPTPTPTPTPVGTTPSPSPSPTPHVSEGYIPFASQASFVGSNSGGSSDTGFITLGYDLSSNMCSTGVPNTSGDVKMDPNPQKPYLMDYSVFTSPAFATVTPSLIVSKDIVTKDVYLVGYYDPATSSEHCVPPGYLIPSSPAITTWTYTGIDGNTRTAQVVGTFPSKAFTPAAGPKAGAPVTYNNVVEVQYGASFFVYWALGVGPVETHNAVAAQGHPTFPLTWDAYNYLVH